MIYVAGDLLDSDCDIIAHQANCFSVFGGGIAAQIAKRFPEEVASERASPLAPRDKLGRALFLAQPFTPADVAAAGITVRSAPLAEVTEWARNPTATGWIGCSLTACDVLMWDGFSPHEAASVTRHEVCHGLDALSDGKMDGMVNDWQPWAGDHEAETGRYDNDAERMGYWCGRQEVR